MKNREKINHAWWHMLAPKGKLKIYIHKVECEPHALCDLDEEHLLKMRSLIDEALREIKE